MVAAATTQPASEDRRLPRRGAAARWRAAPRAGPAPVPAARRSDRGAWHNLTVGSPRVGLMVCRGACSVRAAGCTGARHPQPGARQRTADEGMMRTLVRDGREPAPQRVADGDEPTRRWLAIAPVDPERFRGGGWWRRSGLGRTRRVVRDLGGNGTRPVPCASPEARCRRGVESVPDATDRRHGSCRSSELAT
jgi:hypothetical protein